MEVGERFEFVEFKFHGRIQWLPVHPKHLTDNKQKTKLEQIISRADKDNSKELINASGMVGLIQWLKLGYKVQRWDHRGPNVKIWLTSPEPFRAYVTWYI